MINKDVEIRNAYKYYGSNLILDGINLEIKQGELITLLGPSGCGKTTTLNVIAGFIDLDQGEVYIRNKKMNGIPAYKRDLGMVFQTYSLFPHMTVYENLEFGLSLRKIANAEKLKRINQALELIRMEGLGNRYPRELSGGQRQRVAIARALVVQPQLLLLDEPLSNLDAKLRVELREEIKRLQKEVGVTTIFVTHDQEEALSISDRIAVMNGGKIEQIGTPTEIYEKPHTEFVFQFIGKSNHFTGRIISVNEQSSQVQVGDETIINVKADNIMGENIEIKSGDEVSLYIRPEKIVIEPELKFEQFDNNVSAKIVQTNLLGVYWEIELDWQGKLLQVISPIIHPDWTKESVVTVKWKSSDMILVKK